MRQILVRQMKDDVVLRLRQRANRHQRSLEAEARIILEEAAAHDREVDAWEEAVRFAGKVRRELRGKSSRDSTDLIREDRDRR